MASRIQLVVGLGNPGPKYERTRHNAGFWFIDELARRHGIHLKLENKFHGEAGKGTINGHEVWLLKPTTFMNKSGQSVQGLAQFYKIPLENILVAHDELDLPPGKVKLKQGGGHAGHNGLRDIGARMGADFLRLRIGIGHPGHASAVTGYVLGNAPSDEQISMDRTIDACSDALPWLLEGDISKAMNHLHSFKA